MWLNQSGQLCRATNYDSRHTTRLGPDNCSTRPTRACSRKCAHCYSCVCSCCVGGSVLGGPGPPASDLEGSSRRDASQRWRRVVAGAWRGIAQQGAKVDCGLVPVRVLDQDVLGPCCGGRGRHGWRLSASGYLSNTRAGSCGSHGCLACDGLVKVYSVDEIHDEADTVTVDDGLADLDHTRKVEPLAPRRYVVPS
jgi:hypothetical protein